MRDARQFVRENGTSADAEVAGELLDRALACETLPPPIDSPPAACVNCDAPSGKDLFCCHTCTRAAFLVRAARKLIGERLARSARLRAAEDVGSVVTWLRTHDDPKSDRLDIATGAAARLTALYEVRCWQCGAPAEVIDGDFEHFRRDDFVFSCKRHSPGTMASGAGRAGGNEATKTLDYLRFVEIEERVQSVVPRIAATEPLRVCDRPDWPQTWRAVQKERRANAR